MARVGAGRLHSPVNRGGRQTQPAGSRQEALDRHRSDHQAPGQYSVAWWTLSCGDEHSASGRADSGRADSNQRAPNCPQPRRLGLSIRLVYRYRHSSPAARRNSKHRPPPPHSRLYQSAKLLAAETLLSSVL